MLLDSHLQLTGRHLVYVYVVKVLTVLLDDIQGVVSSVLHECLHKAPVDTLQRNVWTHAQVMPRPIRPVEAVRRQIGMAHHRCSKSFKAVAYDASVTKFHVEPFGDICLYALDRAFAAPPSC